MNSSVSKIASEPFLDADSRAYWVKIARLNTVTPFTPTDWKMMFDGETVSLNPSIGNWTLACRSHYVIKRGRVIEAGPWTDKQVEAERRRDRTAKARFFGVPEPTEPVTTEGQAETPSQAKPGFVGRILRWVAKVGC